MDGDHDMNSNEELADECLEYLMTVVRNTELPTELRIASSRFVLDFVLEKPASHTISDVGIMTGRNSGAD